MLRLAPAKAVTARGMRMSARPAIMRLGAAPVTANARETGLFCNRRYLNRRGLEGARVM